MANQKSQSSSGHRIDGDAEQAVIGACFSGGRRAIEEALEAGLAADDFAVGGLGLMWSAMVRLSDADKHVDVLQVVEDLMAHAELDAAGGAAGCQHIALQMVTPEAVPQKARMVVEHAAFRRISSATQEIGMMAIARGMPAIELISLAQATFIDLNSHISSAADIVDRPATVREVLASAGKTAPGAIPTGFPELDGFMDGGLLPSTLTLIAGRPGQGKTAVALAIAGFLADMGIPVGFIELEMPARALIAREISSIAGISKQEWAISRENMARVTEAGAIVDARPIHIIDRPGLTAAEICACARRMKARHGIGALFVDHIGKVKASDRYAGDRNNETGEVSEALRALSGTLDIPVIALCQLNRGVEGRTDKRPGLGDLRDSGTLEQDAHAVIFPFRPEYYLKDKCPESDIGLCELDLAKNRDGAVGTARVRFDAATQRFSPRFD